MMRANSAMKVRLSTVHQSRGLAPALAKLSESPLEVVGDAVVLRDLLDGSALPSFEDAVSMEAWVNKIHIEDYVSSDRTEELLAQAVLFGEALVTRLASIRRPFRILLSLDAEANAVTVRFFVRRPNQSWGSDDVECYGSEEVIQWDTGEPVASV